MNFVAHDFFFLQVNLAIILEDMELTMEEFVDLCILCGCDYTNTIPGVGPKTSLSLIKKYKNIEAALSKGVDKKKHPYVLGSGR